MALHYQFGVQTFINPNPKTGQFMIAGKVYYEDGRESELWPLGTALTREGANQIAAAWRQGRRAELQLKAAEKR